jgi:hypothetical protein
MIAVCVSALLPFWGVLVTGVALDRTVGVYGAATRRRLYGAALLAALFVTAVWYSFGLV